MQANPLLGCAWGHTEKHGGIARPKSLKIAMSVAACGSATTMSMSLDPLVGSISSFLPFWGRWFNGTHGTILETVITASLSSSCGLGSAECS